MNTREDFYRKDEMGSEQRLLPAAVYNSTRLLLEHSEAACVFVPIRSMQYLAVIDHEEIIFVDAIAGRRHVEFAWRRFQPQVRSDLVSPVPYTFVHYEHKALETMRQAQGEFSRFVHLQREREERERTADSGSVIEFSDRPAG